jgi:thiol:disulfide interchange protein DsbD
MLTLRTLLAASLAALPALLGPGRAWAQEKPTDLVKAEARMAVDGVVDGTVPAGGAVPAGGVGRLEVTLRVAEGWHIYGPGDHYNQDTVLKVASGAEGLEVGAFAPTTKPKSHKFEFDDGPRMEFEGTVVYAAEVRVPAGAKSGERTLVGAAAVNICDAQRCLDPGEVPFTVKFSVVPGDGKAPPPPKPAPPTVPPAVEAGTPPPPADEGISVAFLLAAVVGGLLTIVTPCVFPMLPLTVSLLTKRAEKEPGRIVPNAVAYGAGMFVSLAGIGLAMSLVFGVAPTDLALSPGFNIAIFVFLGYLALSLFGLYDIQLPAFLTDWAQGKTGAGGGVGLFFMGMTLAFTSFACAAPFAGVLVLEARESVLKGVVGMSVYAGTFTLPFFVTALFPGLLKKLPRSGGWLNSVKVVMGFVEVAAAFKFVRAADMLWGWGLFSFELVLGIWIACALGAALYLFDVFRFPHDTKPERLGLGRPAWAILFLAAAGLLAPGLAGRRISPVVESFIIREEEEGQGGSWIRNDLDKALAEAKEHGKPVFVDFTGFG